MVAIVTDQGTLPVEKNWTVARDRAGIRLDAFVREVLPQLSRRETEKAIAQKFFLIDGKPARKGQRLAAGSLISFAGSETWLSQRPRPNSRLRVTIVYEDSHLLVVDKPAGMDTHGFSGQNGQTVANFLAAERPALLDVGTSRWEPGLVHRLDRETSGLLLVAKTQEAFDHLRTQFRLRQIKKIYWALVWGSTAFEGSIAYSLAHDARDKKRMRAVTALMGRRQQKSWKAVTRFRKLAQARGLSLLEIKMETGVMHQIRAHLAAIGHPIVGDALYGAEKVETFGLRRHFLHARALELQHPATGRPLKLEAALPRELSGALRRLTMDF